MIENNEQGKILLKIARAAIARALRVPYEAAAVERNIAWLSKPGATFVTLMQDGDLRGCIGSLQARDPLIDDVSNNAVAAALRDPRFSPLTVNELGAVNIEVSLLSGLQSLVFSTEEDVLQQLRPSIDGVVLEYGSHRGTFLPQVWEALPQPRQFLSHLKLKARLPGDFWADDVRLSRYTVSKWRETDFSEEYIHG